MQINLDNEWVKKLQSQPETSMGRQDVRVHFADGKQIRGLVLDCSILVTKDDINIDNVTDILVDGRELEIAFHSQR